MTINGFFSNRVLKTKIVSANVKPGEMILGYFIGPFLALISNAIFGSYLNRYYSDVIGWTDTSVYGVFSAVLPMISVVFVILGNLLAGRLIDKTRTVQGKARPYMFISAPIITIAISLLFLTPMDKSIQIRMVWIAVSYNLYYAVAYPFFYTAHSSMVALSTRNSHHRGVLATLSNASAVAAVGIGASIVIPVLLQSFIFKETNGIIDQAASYKNWQIVMIVLCIITFLAIIFEYYFTRERVTEENIKLDIKEKPVSMLKQVKACVNNRYWWLIVIYFLLFQLAGLIKNGSMSFYSRWIFDSVSDETTAGRAMAALGLIGGMPTALGIFFAWPIARKLGKQKAIILGLIITVTAGSVGLFNPHNFITVCIGRFFRSIGSVPAMYVSLALMSDILDHLEAKNGFRSDGFTMSVYGSIMVGLMGIGNGVINTLLTSSGYDPSLAVQNPHVQRMLIICFLGIEKVSYAILIIIMIFLKVEKHIDEDQKAIIEFQKKSVLESGGVWIDPHERLKNEQLEEEKAAEVNRIKEKKAYCLKRGLNFDIEEAKYQDKLKSKRRKKYRVT